MSTILKENRGYLELFTGVVNIIFTISSSTLKSPKISPNDMENILEQIDKLIRLIGEKFLGVDESVIDVIYALFFLITNKGTASMKKNDKLKDKNHCL